MSVTLFFLFVQMYLVAGAFAVYRRAKHGGKPLTDGESIAVLVLWPLHFIATKARRQGWRAR